MYEFALVDLVVVEAFRASAHQERPAQRGRGGTGGWTFTSQTLGPTAWRQVALTIRTYVGFRWTGQPGPPGRSLTVVRTNC